MTNHDTKLTHFGYKTVAADEKSGLVAEVFQSVAAKYDVMNDVMSFGLHRLWKKIAITELDLRPGLTVLDVASGTGDLASEAAKIVGRGGLVIMTDVNEAMLQLGRSKLIDKNVMGNIDYVLADAQKLPFKDHFFDRICIAFGLRNVTDKEAALQSMYRVLKPGGHLLVLEFSKPKSEVINKLYEFYSFKIIPQMGALIAQDRSSYDYLVESIRMHPGQEQLKLMMENVGFEDVGYTNLQNGIVALHKGRKY